MIPVGDHAADGLGIPLVSIRAQYGLFTVIFQTGLDLSNRSPVMFSKYDKIFHGMPLNEGSVYLRRLYTASQK